VGEGGGKGRERGKRSRGRGGRGTGGEFLADFRRRNSGTWKEIISTCLRKDFYFLFSQVKSGVCQWKLIVSTSSNYILYTFQRCSIARPDLNNVKYKLS
jgi:hypothetical protein